MNFIQTTEDTYKQEQKIKERKKLQHITYKYLKIKKKMDSQIYSVHYKQTEQHRESDGIHTEKQNNCLEVLI